MTPVISWRRTFSKVINLFQAVFAPVFTPD